MKTIKLIVLSAGLLVLTMSGIHAQTFGDFRKMPAEQKAKLVTDSLGVILNFTGDQHNKIYAILLDGAQKARPVLQSSDSRISKAQQLWQLFKQQEVKAKRVLTPQQYSLYQAKKKQAIAYYRKHWQEEKLVFSIPG